MSDRLDWNAKIIADFRANEGRVGGNFEGAPMALLHHRGRKSGREWRVPYRALELWVERVAQGAARPRAPVPRRRGRPPDAPVSRLSAHKAARCPIESCPERMCCAPGAHKSESPHERLQGRCPFRCPRRCAAVAGAGRV